MIVPFGPYQPDVSNYRANLCAYLNNVFPRGDGYGPVQALTAVTTALAGTCRGFFYARNTDGTVSVFAGTATKLYQLNNTTYAWTDVSKGAGSYTTLTSTQNWQFAQFGALVIAVQPNTAPQVFTLGVSSAFADLGGSPPQAAYVAVVGRFVVLTGIASPNSYRIQWSAIGDATGWTSGVSSSDYQDLPDGGIVRGVAGGEYGLVFQDSVIRRIVYQPGSSVVFSIEKITDDKGLLCPYSVARAGDRVFFLASQGFQMLTSTGIPTPIGKERVDRTFFADLDTGNLQLVIGAADPQENRVYWAYKSLGGVAGMFDKILCYDYALDRWSPITTFGEYLATFAQPGITLDALDSVYPSIDAMLISLDDFSTAALNKFAAFDSSHVLGFFSGNNLEATLDTGEQLLDGAQRMRVRGLRPVTDAANCYGSIGARETPQESVVYSTEQAVNVRGLCPANVSTRLARGRLRVDSATTWSYVTAVDPEIAPEGIR